MIGRLLHFFSAPTASADGADCVSEDDVSRVRDQMAALNKTPYLMVADSDLGILSVFDDLKYDRADADMMSPPMRNHVVEKLAPIGFRQVTGTVLEHRAAGIRCLIPKFHALGTSPFDITQYTPKRACDYYVLTPTQTACRLIDSYTTDEAVERIKALIAKQPVNLVKLVDYLERKPSHRAFSHAIGHLKYVQRQAITSEPLCRRRALGSRMF